MTRQGRTWLLTLGLVLGAVGLYLFSSSGVPELPRPPLLSSPDQLLALRLLPAGGEPLAFRRIGEGFRLTEPVDTPADLQKMKALLEQLAALGSGEPVDPGEKPLSTYGLDLPGWTLELTTTSGPRRLELGAESPFDGRSYLRVDGEALLLVSTALARRLDARPQHWREKRMVPDPPESLDHLRLQTADRDLGLERRERGWILLGAEETPIPETGVRRLIRGLTENRAVAFEAAAGEKPPADTPGEARLVVGRGEDRRGIELFALEQDAGPGVQARGTALSPWVRLRPGAYQQILALFESAAAGSD